MNTKKKLLFSFVGLILSISVFATVVFAWFAIGDSTADFTVETGNIKSNIELYAGKWNGSEYIWTLVDEEDDATRLFQNMIPGQILTFRLDVINDEDSNVSVTYSIDLGMLYYCNDLHHQEWLFLVLNIV